MVMGPKTSLTTGDTRRQYLPTVAGPPFFGVNSQPARIPTVCFSCQQLTGWHGSKRAITCTAGMPQGFCSPHGITETRVRRPLLLCKVALPIKKGIQGQKLCWHNSTKGLSSQPGTQWQNPFTFLNMLLLHIPWA